MGLKLCYYAYGVIDNRLGVTMPDKNHSEVQALLKKWEEAYKKGLLSFWLLLLLHEKPAYPYALGEAILLLSQGTVSTDEQSIYRALNRFQSMSLVKSELVKSPIGPQRRYYRLTEKGTDLLREFTQRNILIFQNPSIQERVQSILQNDAAVFQLEMSHAIPQT
jgi:DNA-binding PadR family transcriptional regulator